jgi:hypothetical protein
VLQSTGLFVGMVVVLTIIDSPLLGFSSLQMGDFGEFERD